MIAQLSPEHYVHSKWKNGGGVMIDIARSGETWRFSRTPIDKPGPFSDYAGFDRCQVLIGGRGLVLGTPEGDIDVRLPYRPVSFTGERRIVSRLENGPVEVVNLIGERAAVRIDLKVLEAGQQTELSPGIHFAYAPTAPAEVAVEGKIHVLIMDHCLRIEPASQTILACINGRLLAASIVPV